MEVPVVCFLVLDFRGSPWRDVSFGTLAWWCTLSTYLRYAHAEIDVPSLRLLLAREQCLLGFPLH